MKTIEGWRDLGEFYDEYMYIVYIKSRHTELIDLYRPYKITRNSFFGIGHEMKNDEYANNLAKDEKAILYKTAQELPKLYQTMYGEK